MEHLIFDADCPEETKSAVLSPSLRMDWDSEIELMDFVAPKTLWLRFDHNEVPLCRLADYPARAGWNESHLWNAKFCDAWSGFSDIPISEVVGRVASFFQAWLFFGLLESVVGKKIETSYFVRQGHLYTRNLHFCLQSKVFRIRADPTAKARVNKEIQLDVRLVHRWVTRFTAWSHSSFKPKIEADYPGLLDQLEDIVPAIIRLAEAIEQTRLFTLQDQPFMGTLSWVYPFRARKVRKHRLKALGWCPFQIMLLQDTVNHSTMDWIVASGVQQSSVGHEICTKTQCARNNIDNNTYKQSHVCENEVSCLKMIPPVSKIMDILINDDIPVVRLESGSGVDRLEVTAISKNKPTPFIAISHVWADGLGGDSETGLNSCQVERLHTLCASVLRPPECPWFWLDCLCIIPKTYKEVYYKALDRIKDVYKCASSVIVLDKTIQKCSMDSTTEFLYAHIYLSAWMQRMWTYEEAVLSKELLFVLGDGLHKYRVDTQPSMRRTISVVWQSLASQLFRLRAGPNHLTIGHICGAFRYRLCNVPEDEFVSVAGMLGIDAMALLRENGDERTKHFWLMLHSVPRDVVFLTGPKLSFPGFRWAPRTLMNPSITTLDTAVADGDEAECTVSGLIGTYVTVKFNPALIGRGQGHGSIFNLWVEGSAEGVQPARDTRALLRLYCTENWPCNGLGFDLIILPINLAFILEPGQWVPSVALQKDGCSVQDPRPPSYRYVGRLLVERIKDEEMTVSDGTIMFEGRSRVVINTHGKWQTRTLCIT
ncbi:hypothetical protein F5Y08DRAFT_313072 [Xylaria arbuscula]|nr:hypothetical protein F5Y08DRAFT_313072 [Xylaria arbuscula]